MRTTMRVAALLLLLLLLTALTWTLIRVRSQVGQHQTITVVPPHLFAGSTARVRVLTRTYSTGSPIARSVVRLELVNKTEATVATARGTTDENGTASVVLPVGESLHGGYRLRVETGSDFGRDELVEPVEIVRPARLYLTTDKPVYQPGQTIHIRCLAMDYFRMKPFEDRDIILSVFDSKENKVLKRRMGTSRFGVVSAEFLLDTEVLTGTYRVTASMDEVESSRNVTVKKYALPKFKVRLDTDTSYSLPGEVLAGTVSVRYFFGKPVDGGTVRLKLSTFDTGFNTVGEVLGETNSDGVFRFEYPLPPHFTGLPLKKGDALLFLDAEVTDTAGQTETVRYTQTVSKERLKVEVVPESGRLSAGLDNIIYFVTCYPDGTPARCELTVNGSRVLTDRMGIGSMVFKPAEEESSLIIQAVDDRGNRLERIERMSCRRGRQSVLLRTDRSLYESGQTACFQVFSTVGKGMAFMDFLKDGQVVFTTTIPLEGGRGQVELDLPGDLFGSMELNAYLVTREADIIRDSKVIYVKQTGQLKVDILSEKEVYRPGETGKISLRVTDENGTGREALLGISVVDESVFSVAADDASLARIYFTLEKELLEPKYQVKYGAAGFDMAGMIEDRGVVDRGVVDRGVVSNILFARLPLLSAVSLVTEPLESKIEKHRRHSQQSTRSINRTLFLLVCSLALLAGIMAFGAVIARFRCDLGCYSMTEADDLSRLRKPVFNRSRVAFNISFILLLFVVALAVYEPGIHQALTSGKLLRGFLFDIRSVMASLVLIGIFSLMAWNVRSAMSVVKQETVPVPSGVCYLAVSMALICASLHVYLAEHVVDAAWGSSSSELCALLMLVVVPLIVFVNSVSVRKEAAGFYSCIACLIILPLVLVLVFIYLVVVIALGAGLAGLLPYYVSDSPPFILLGIAFIMISTGFLINILSKHMMNGLKKMLIPPAWNRWEIELSLDTGQNRVFAYSIVVLIIAMLVSISLPQFASMSGDSKMAKARQDMDVLVGAKIRHDAMEPGPETGRRRRDTQAGDRPRVRSWFPETLYVNPALLTDGEGKAELDLKLADSITDWRFTCFASDRHGRLGAANAAVRVFQDFFIDLDLPPVLTEHDCISIPVACYNYLREPQEIRVVLKEADWFRMEAGPLEKSVVLASSAVGVVHFPVKITGHGIKEVTVEAYGTSMSDALSRRLEVVPDGKLVEQSVNGYIRDTVLQTVDFPPGSQAGKILVKLYPGVFSQVVEGLDGMLQMPHGCFEQTTSITYPNIMVLQYLRGSARTTPEMEMKALQYINLGYQRLLKFEIDGGGFSYFGHPPALLGLTAYGLSEFVDMAELIEIDRDVIARTRAWLLKQQNQDGSWRQGGSRRGWDQSVSLTTAYITWALVRSGYLGDGIERAFSYLDGQGRMPENTYFLALYTLAAAEYYGQDHSRIGQALEALYRARSENEEECWWSTEAQTMTRSSGATASMETTSLAALVFIKSAVHSSSVLKALNFLLKHKDSRGTWGSTHATVLALGTLTAASGKTLKTVDSQAFVDVSVDDEPVGTVTVDPENWDVVKMVDTGECPPGRHVVEMKLRGEANVIYQVVQKYYRPWEHLPEKRKKKVEIEVDYDRRKLAVNDTVTCRVGVSYNGRRQSSMIIVDLGVPPGFSPVTADLESLLKKRAVRKYSVTPRQIIVYLDGMGPGEYLEFACRLKARFPIRAKTPRSRIYEYYNPDVQDIEEPVSIEVMEI